MLSSVVHEKSFITSGPGEETVNKPILVSFVLFFYVQVNIFSVMSGRVYLG